MATMHVWTAEGVAALRAGGPALAGEGGRAAGRRVPSDQVEEIEEGCVTWWGALARGLSVSVAVTVWPGEGRAAVASGGESAWGAYDAEFGLVTVGVEGVELEVVVHAATADAVGREAVARADAFFARSRAGDAAWPGGGGEFLAWCERARRAGLPDDDDGRALARAVRALAGRAPTGRERRGFEEAFLERLWLRRLETPGAG
jgi:hypothetical protein